MANIYFSNILIKNSNLEIVIDRLKNFKNISKSSSNLTSLDSQSIFIGKKTLSFNNENIEIYKFNLITEREVEKEVDDKGKLLDEVKRKTRYVADAYLYKAGEHTYISILKGVSTANYFIKDIIEEITEIIFELDQDRFKDNILYWLYYKEYKKIDLIKDEKNLKIKNIETYVGTSQDEVNKIKAVGCQTSSLLATLGNIFSSEKFKKLKFEVLSNDAEVNIEINTNGTYRCVDTSCEFNEEVQREDKVIYLILYFNLFLFPFLLKLNEEEVSNGLWSERVKLEFLKGVGELIKEEAEKGLAYINKKLDMLDKKE